MTGGKKLLVPLVHSVFKFLRVISSVFFFLRCFFNLNSSGFGGIVWYIYKQLEQLKHYVIVILNFLCWPVHFPVDRLIQFQIADHTTVHVRRAKNICSKGEIFLTFFYFPLPLLLLQLFSRIFGA